MQSVHYARFKSLCYTGFTTLRKNANLLINLVALMVAGNIPDIRTAPDQAVMKVRGRLLSLLHVPRSPTPDGKTCGFARTASRQVSPQPCRRRGDQGLRGAPLREELPHQHLRLWPRHRSVLALLISPLSLSFFLPYHTRSFIPPCCRLPSFFRATQSSRFSPSLFFRHCLSESDPDYNDRRRKGNRGIGTRRKEGSTRRRVSTLKRGEWKEMGVKKKQRKKEGEGGIVKEREEESHRSNIT